MGELPGKPQNKNQANKVNLLFLVGSHCIIFIPTKNDNEDTLGTAKDIIQKCFQHINNNKKYNADGTDSDTNADIYNTDDANKVVGAGETADADTYDADSASEVVNAGKAADADKVFDAVDADGAVNADEAGDADNDLKITNYFNPNDLSEFYKSSTREESILVPLDTKLEDCEGKRFKA
ncbi:hypothetical protein COEREDRAFT_89517 [Coemansia reversa NRRL 1564]|uniref:Uncharacterized protein n=1 Tax=Coemansia reversa (strain ATCC 12441 / NRRL 1564) TaxID=763665 RepID=A0A2G5B3A5_COERN|nr:hypothetical protein COEREDRAFT_89517 [Coemansia reversa NRRL 1564]|eukprot:PIA13503.1 hypothetical protein COEREDRAFT_89517 [Coemansia reversa NRRL 1564]